MTQALVERDDNLYRPCVGITLFNKEGLVFVGERLDNPGAWQMPQGGIDEGEDIDIAVFREMEEEIGTRNARILGMINEWIYYDIPARTAKRLWNNRYCGQRQKWVALEFTGSDSDIRLDAFTHPEFGSWKWVPIGALLDYAVPFKRDVYSRVMREFEPFARSLAK
jgi:putative (di)nucleoside polyphosphate hydrolase